MDGKRRKTASIDHDDDPFTRCLYFCCLTHRNSLSSSLTSGDNAALGTVGWNRHCKCTVVNTKKLQRKAASCQRRCYVVVLSHVFVERLAGEDL